MTTKERIDQDDKQIAVIRELIHEGMRLVLETRKDLRRIAVAHQRLEAAQERTEASLRSLIDSMKVGGNGHTKRRVE